MKQLVIAAALSLSLAAIPALANTTFVANPSLTGSSHSSDDSFSWYSSCPTDLVNVTQQLNKKHKGDGIEVFINVARSQENSVASQSGGNAIDVVCNGATFDVIPGSSFMCKTSGNVTWHAEYAGDPANGTFTIEY